MMKKWFTVLLVGLLMLTCLAVPAAADDNGLPFEVVPPAYLTAEWLNGGDSPTTTKLTYSLSNEMTDWFKRVENANLDGTIGELLEKYGLADFWLNIQIDWALDDVEDSVSGWHYTEYWDGDPYYGLGHDSEGRSRWSEWDVVDAGLNNATETVQDIWVTRGLPNDERWNGNPEMLMPGVKDQLNPDQYTYDAEEETLWIDYAEHTMYFRARFVAVVRVDGEPDRYVFSEWSNIASVGKGAEAFEPLTKEDLAAPVITSLRMTDKEFNDNPIVAFTLTVPDKLMENATVVEAHGGGITIEVEARVQGDAEFTPLQGDWIIRAGEMESALFALANESRPTVPKDSVIELRCRYRYDDPQYFDGEIYSDWSKIISFGTDDINYHTNPGSDGTAAPDDPQAPAKNSCPICHFCPQPLGICIFIWLLILVIVIVVIVIIAKASGKKKKGEKKDKEDK